MATTEETLQKIDTFFTTLQHQQTLISKCTHLHKTLSTHLTTLQTTLNSTLQTLDSNLLTLDSTLSQTLDSLLHREDSLPLRLSSLSSSVETNLHLALSEVSKPFPDDSAPSAEILKSVCRRMDYAALMKVLVGKRRESSALRAEMVTALSECVDAERFVIEVVREFVEKKREKAAGLTDRRWACSMVVGSRFAPEELRKEKERVGPGFSKKAVERAEEVLKEWKEVAEAVAEESGGSGMAPAEAAMFVEVVLGFGVKEMFEEEFYRKLMVEFCGRRDMAKLAIPIFKDKVADLIDELIRNGKEVEAVYFASESGLTDKFQPVSLLKCCLRNSKKNAAEILKKGKNSSAATDEANSLEMALIKSMIKCVEDHKIEAEFPLENLRKRLTVLEKSKADRKKGGSTSGYNKRVHGSGGARSSGLPPSRAAKMPKLSSSYPPYGGRDHVSPAISPVSRYLSPYSYSSQTTYEAGLTAPAYGQSYGAPHTTTATQDQITQQHYGISATGENVAGTGPRLGSSYSTQTGYGTYDYGATAALAYRPPSYPQ